MGRVLIFFPIYGISLQYLGAQLHRIFIRQSRALIPLVQRQPVTAPVSGISLDIAKPQM